MNTHTIVPAVALLLKKDNKIFVGRRQNTGYFDEHLNFPAGHIDPGETPQQAIVRECAEEIGITINETDLQFIHVQYNRNEVNELDRTHYYFAVDGDKYEPTNTEPHKCSEVLWVVAGDRLNEFVPYYEGSFGSDYGR